MKLSQIFLTLICLTLLHVSHTEASTNTFFPTDPQMHQYSKVPSFISESEKPSTMIILDSSGSMREMIYKEDRAWRNWNGGCYNALTGFIPTKEYYGLFNNKAYYDWDETNDYFVKSSSGEWSGNFMNWMVMRRVDVAKKVLTGGKTELTDSTILLPHNDIAYDIRRVYNDTNTVTDVNGDPRHMTPYHNPFYAYFSVAGGYQNLQIYPTTNMNTSCGSGTYVVDTDSDHRQFNEHIRIKVAPEDLKYDSDNNGVADSPSGIIQKNGSDIRFGLTIFDTNDGDAGEDDPPNLDDTDYNGGEVQAYVGSSVADVVSKINATPTNSWTPLAETLYTVAGNYQQHSAVSINTGPRYALDSYNVGVGTVYDPLYFSNKNQFVYCSKPFVIMITDGEATRDGIVPPPVNTAGNSSPVSSSGYLDNVAYWAHTTDLRADLDDQQSITFYGVFAFGSGTTLRNAAINGSFVDKDGNGLPNSFTDEANAALEDKEWDFDGDGSPDNYAEASDGEQLEEALNKAMNDILRSLASGTASSVISSSRRGEGAAFQAIFIPEYLDQSDHAVEWIGDLNAMFKDNFGNLREDTDGNGQLDYGIDRVARIIYENGKARVNLYYDVDADGDLEFDEDIDGDRLAHRAMGLDDCDHNEDIDNDGNLDVDEDLNGNKRLDSEDKDCDGYLDKTEDINGNGIFDPGEDIDGDGHFDWINEDYDHDCVLNTVPEDIDGDGILDIDEDFDGDGVLNPGEDRNRNGILDPSEDINNNGILDPGEDTYGNGILDLGEDINHDGICQPSEDVNGNGFCDPSEDVNSNGILDPGEDTYGNGILDLGEDIDGDGVIDLYEDYDGDGKLDLVGEDIDGDGFLDRYEDIDGDGTLDTINEDLDGDGHLDTINEDIDGDGFLDRYEDIDGDGILDTTNEDLDGDGHLDTINEDIDGDGFLDINEDRDGDGTLDTTNEDLDGDGRLDTVNEDANGNGILDPGEDMDGDGHLDVNEDLDGDGNLDIDEDFDGDGLLNTVPEDLDGDGHLDTINEDLDGDGNLDVDEDFDGDGLLGTVNEDLDGDGNLDTINEDLDGDGNLDINEDFDGDGLLGTVNEDIDGDGNLDVSEDIDGDGILDIDEDFDGDGLLGSTVEDVDGDGIMDINEDLDSDGYLDIGEDTNCNGVIDGEDVDGDCRLDLYNEDIDLDGRLDFEEDVDQDGVCDVDEAAINNTVDLLNMHFLWSAGRNLGIMTDADTDNRNIITSFDANLDGMVDPSDVREFTASGSNSIVNESNIFTFFNFPLMDPPTSTSYQNAFDYDDDNDTTEDPDDLSLLINYIRGKDASLSRSRELWLDIDQNGTDETQCTWRLGDIINSSPVMVQKPMENFDLLYNDNSYRLFAKKYLKRRQVLYVGSNDGMLRAINGGFYDKNIKKIWRNRNVDYNPYDALTTNNVEFTDTGAALGDELWAYVPYNLLPHLNWLTRTGYEHVYYVDQRSRVADVKIFEEESVCRTSTKGIYDPNCIHPNGWGTILIGGMRFGGGPITVDSNGDGSIDSSDQTLGSSYFVLDITDPESGPVFLGEFTFDDFSFTTSNPTIIQMKNSKSQNGMDWYLAFGTGPTTLRGESDQNGKIYILKLRYDPIGANKLGDWVTSSHTPAGKNWFAELSENKSFISDMISVDFEIGSSPQSFMDDAIYFGSVAGGFKETPTEDLNDNGVIDAGEDTDSDGILDVGPYANNDGILDTGWNGDLYRIILNDDPDPTQWFFGSYSGGTANWANPFVTVGAPISAAPSISTDKDNRIWVYAGTGRYFDKVDDIDVSSQYIFGVMEPVDIHDNMTAETALRSNLLDVTDAKVYNGNTADEAQVRGVPGANNFSWLIQRAFEHGGWSRDLIQSTTERIISSPIIYGGTVFANSYAPNQEVCSAGGYSWAYGLYYLTGTAYYKSILGSYLDDKLNNKEKNKEFLPAGEGKGGRIVIDDPGGEGGTRVNIQSSTGAIDQLETETPLDTRSGRLFWKNEF